jgi:spermidine synthase
LIIILLTTGILSILGQVVILRELHVAFYGVELIYILAIGIWLFGTAFGATVGRRDYLPALTVVRLLLLFCGITILLDVVFIRSIRFLFSEVPGAFLPFTGQIVALLIAITPVSFLLGLLFQWIAKLYISTQKTLAGAYAIESAGWIIGGIAATVLAILGVQNLVMAGLCFILVLCAIIALYISALRKLTCKRITVPIILISGLIILLGKSASIDDMMTAWTHPHLVASRDTQYSRVTVSKYADQIAIFENDALSYDSQSSAAEEFIHLSVLQHDKPENILLLGGGYGGILSELLKHPVEHIDYVELNAALLTMLQHHLPGELQPRLRDKKVNTVVADPRQFVRQAGKYDMIIIAMPEPNSGQTNRFYTREFFQLCRQHLNPGGIVVFQLRSAENLWTPQLTKRNVSIYLALEKSFNDCIVFPGVTNTFIGADQSLAAHAAVIIKRFHERDIQARLINPGYIRYIYDNDRFSQLKKIFKTEKALVNSDTHPVCYQYTTMIWLSKFFPSLTAVELLEPERQNHHSFLLLIIPLAALFFISRFRFKLRQIFFVFVAGFAGMVFETLVILNYQVQNGALYQDIGILLTGFMVGLFAGAFTISRIATKQKDRYVLSFKSVLLLTLLMGAIAVLYGYQLTATLFSGLFGSIVLLMLGGFYVAGIFAYVSLKSVKEQRTIVSPLYSADLLGGGLGAWFATLLIIPLFGLPDTAFFLFFLILLTFIFI